MEYIYDDNSTMTFDNEVFKRTGLIRRLSVIDGNSTNIFSDDDDFTLNDFPLTEVIIVLSILLILVLCCFSCIYYSCISYCKKSLINENINENNTIV